VIRGRLMCKTASRGLRKTRSSAVAERPCDASCHWIFRSRSFKVIRNGTLQ